MIETRLNLTGEIATRQELNGMVNKSVKFIDPITQEKTATPLITSQEITYDDGYTGLSKVTISGVTNTIDSNIQAGNIKDGVSILGVEGTLLEAKEEQSKSVTITTNGSTSVTPDTNKVLSEVSITTNVLPDTSDATAIQSDIASGKTAYVSGGKVTGTLETLGGQNIRGSYDRAGLLEIGYTNDMVDVYDGICSHYKLENSLYTLTQEDKGYYGVVNENNTDTYKYEIKYMPMFNITNNYFSQKFQNYYILKTIPLINTRSCVYMSGVFYGCKCLETIPLLDTSNVIDMNTMFYYCSSLKTIPLLNTSKVTNMNSMFYYCSALEKIPLLDTSKVTNMSSMFSCCSALKEIPLLDTSKVTNMGSAFSSCSALETIPQIDTSNVINSSYMLSSNVTLKTVPLLNLASSTNVSGILNYCYSLTNLGGFQNLGQAYLTTANANTTNYILQLSNSANLTHDSLMNVINNLYDIATKGVRPQKLILGATNMAKLTATEIAIATAKGWTVS